ncbi:MAG TPA: ORF6C domain-containing protein [Candidatus Paceibacterota bacterium]
MNNLTIINRNGQLLLSSREVTKMIGKDHKHLLRDIQGYMVILGESKFGPSDFFIEDVYLNSQNKEQPCYLLTKKGCNMVANKMTGEKGILFTATYVTKFDEMENKIKGTLPQLSNELKAIFSLDKRTVEIGNRVEHLENNMVIEYGQEVSIKKAVDKHVIKVCHGSEAPAYLHKGLRAKIYRAIWKDYKGYFNITSYHNTLKNDFEKALDIVITWKSSGEILREIQIINNQIS